MSTHRASAVWEGNLKNGSGTMKVGDTDIVATYSAAKRFEGEQGASPEALIGAAHAGCFSMALAHAMAEAGHAPERVETKAELDLEKAEGGFAVQRIRLHTTVHAKGLDEDEFAELAKDAKENCPVSRLVKGGASIELEHRLVS